MSSNETSGTNQAVDMAQVMELLNKISRDLSNARSSMGETPEFKELSGRLQKMKEALDRQEFEADTERRQKQLKKEERAILTFLWAGAASLVALAGVGIYSQVRMDKFSRAEAKRLNDAKIEDDKKFMDKALTLNDESFAKLFRKPPPLAIPGLPFSTNPLV